MDSIKSFIIAINNPSIYSIAATVIISYVARLIHNTTGNIRIIILGLVYHIVSIRIVHRIPSISGTVINPTRDIRIHQLRKRHGMSHGGRRDHRQHNYETKQNGQDPL